MSNWSPLHSSTPRWRLAGLVLLLAAALLLFGQRPAHAHHGWGAYDAEKAVKIDVPLVEVRYRNPHGEVTIDYQGKRWEVVLAPISRMKSRGLADDALQPGKTIGLEAYPRRDGTAEFRAERITVDGKVIELR